MTESKERERKGLRVPIFSPTAHPDSSKILFESGASGLNWEFGTMEDTEKTQRSQGASNTTSRVRRPGVFTISLTTPHICTELLSLMKYNFYYLLCQLKIFLCRLR
jgi:hypothetical protein